MSDGLFSEVAATFAGWERDRDLSGSCLVTRGGETLFEASWGFADIAARVPELAFDPVRPGVADEDVHGRRRSDARPR